VSVSVSVCRWGKVWDWTYRAGREGAGTTSEDGRLERHEAGMGRNVLGQQRYARFPVFFTDPRTIFPQKLAIFGICWAVNFDKLRMLLVPEFESHSGGYTNH